LTYSSICSRTYILVSHRSVQRIHQQDVQRSVAARIDVGEDIRAESLPGFLARRRGSLVGAVLLEALQYHFLVSFEDGEVGRLQPMHGFALFVRHHNIKDNDLLDPAIRAFPGIFRTYKTMTLRTIKSALVFGVAIF
jgi:hypothetical protein